MRMTSHNINYKISKYLFCYNLQGIIGKYTNNLNQDKMKEIYYKLFKKCFLAINPLWAQERW